MADMRTLKSACTISDPGSRPDAIAPESSAAGYCVKPEINLGMACRVFSSTRAKIVIPLIGGIASFFRGRTAPAGRGVDDELFRSLAENSADVLCKVGPTGLFSYVSPSATVIFGISPESMIGTPAHTTIVPDDRPIVAAAMARLASGEVSEAVTQVRALRADRRLLWVEATAKRIQSIPTAPAETILVLRDITARKAIENELTSQAREDGLTGLANRRALDEAIDGEWRRTVRTGSQMALIMLDVDHFKLFNDHYGHQAGDDCLRAIAAVVKQSARRAGDVAGRYGGEEFAVLLGNTIDTAAKAVADEIRATVESLAIPHGGIGAGSVVTVSLGVATALARIGGTTRMPETLVQAADNALYRAKDHGRNRVETAILFAPSSD
jgi:diguanylate cyclase (GGDEF)-like protein/PAS domain S-box-containing protein